MHGHAAVTHVVTHVLFKAGGCGYDGEVAHETKIDDRDRLRDGRKKETYNLY